MGTSHGCIHLQGERPFFVQKASKGGTIDQRNGTNIIYVLVHPIVGRFDTSQVVQDLLYFFYQQYGPYGSYHPLEGSEYKWYVTCGTSILPNRSKYIDFLYLPPMHFESNISLKP